MSIIVNASIRFIDATMQDVKITSGALEIVRSSDGYKLAYFSADSWSSVINEQYEDGNQGLQIVMQDGSQIGLANFTTSDLSIDSDYLFIKKDGELIGICKKYAYYFEFDIRTTVFS